MQSAELPTGAGATSAGARLARARPGLLWALAGAVLAANFMLPWKLAAASGETPAVVLVMLTSAALWCSAALPWARRSPGQAPVPALGRAELLLAGQLSLLTLAGNWASARAISQLSPSLLAVLMRSEVLVVALLALGLLGERVERRFWLGCALAGAGLCVIYGPGAALRSPWGLLAGLGAAASFGTMTVMTRRVIRSIDPLRVNALRLWLAVALWFVVNGAPPPLEALSPALLGFAALAALCGPCASRLCLMYSTRHVDARITAMIGLSVPLLTLLIAGFALGEWPSARELGGGALMLLGIALPLTRWVRGSTPPLPTAN